MSCHSRLWIVRALIALALVLASGWLAAPAQAVSIVGWWRMETDNDPGAGFSIPNELPFGNPLIGTSGGIGPDLSTTLPAITQPPMPVNSFGLDGSPDINGIVAPYTALNTDSITVEFFARTNEGLANLFSRATGTGTGNALGTDGLSITTPSDVQVRYFADDGAGGSAQFDLDTNIDLGGAWDHLAFTYDAPSGVGSFYRNGALVTSNDGPDNRPLVWSSIAPVLAGAGMDGAGPFSTNSDVYYDELRIVDAALPPSQFLIGNVGPIPLLAEPPAGPAALVTFTFDQLAGRGAMDIEPSQVADEVVMNAALNINPAVANGVNGTDLNFEVSNPTPNYPTEPVLRVFPANNNDEPEAFANDGFFAFTVEPEDGIILDLDSLVFDAGRGGGSTPRGWAVRSSADNFATVLDMADIPTARPTMTTFAVDLGGSEFQGLTDPLTFRFYVFSPGDGSTVEFDNITLLGTARPPIPEPMTVGLLGLAGAALLGRRRRA